MLKLLIQQLESVIMLRFIIIIPLFSLASEQLSYHNLWWNLKLFFCTCSTFNLIIIKTKNSHDYLGIIGATSLRRLIIIIIIFKILSGFLV